MNSVKLYSNGTAVISKDIVLNGNETKVSIPVKTSDLDDVVSSISVFGNVSLPSPPSYTPTNSSTTTLSLSGKNVFRDLMMKLRGADVEINSSGQKSSGVLYGIEVFNQEVNGNSIERFRVLLGTKTGIMQFDDTVQVNFLSEEVQAEINKAMQKSLQEIKPDSRFVELTIVPVNNAKLAVVSYTTPVAAWKIRYQLRLGEFEPRSSVHSSATLEGQAIVDNDTDDNWNDVRLSVITGDPISFSTDLAEIRRPSRNRINVVSDHVVGAVTPEVMVKPRSGKLSVAAASFATKSMGLESMRSVAAYEDDVVGTDAASFSDAEVKESGDFSIYTATEPVSVESKKSAIIGLFSIPLENAKTVLLFKDGESTRPYRAIKVLNTTTNSFGRGVCEVFVGRDRQGKCIVEVTKPNEEMFLIHALENGVKVFKEAKTDDQRVVSVKISDGKAFTEYLTTAEVVYKIDNSKSEKFDFDVEYKRKMTGSQITANSQDSEISFVETRTGIRVSGSLPASGSLTVVVTEKLLVVNTIADINQYGSNLIRSVRPLAETPAVQKIIELEGSLSEINDGITDANELILSLEHDQTRAIGLIPNLPDHKIVAAKMKLSEVETEIQATKANLAEWKRQQKVVKKELMTAYLSLKTSWNASDYVPQNEPKV